MTHLSEIMLSFQGFDPVTHLMMKILIMNSQCKCPKLLGSMNDRPCLIVSPAEIDRLRAPSQCTACQWNCTYIVVPVFHAGALPASQCRSTRMQSILSDTAGNNLQTLLNIIEVCCLHGAQKVAVLLSLRQPCLDI